MKKLLYMVVDTETATLPIANEIAHGDAERKKRIAIAKPLVYDIGWTICDRQGNIHERKQYLIAETFSVPAVFNTAYYAEKRPLYIEMLNRGETVVMPWREVMKIFIADTASSEFVKNFSPLEMKTSFPFDCKAAITSSNNV